MSEITKVEHTQALQRRRRDLRQLLDRAGKGLATRATWDQYETHHDSRQPAVLAAVKDWAREFNPDTNSPSLLLWGPVGTGKDHLALAAVRTVLTRHDCTSWWQNGRDLAGEWRDRINDNSANQLLTLLMRRTLLVISDPLPPFGDLTNYQADMLYRVVRGRTDAGLATVCTINVESDQEADERLGAPTWDRLTQGSWKIKCNWRSHRTARKVVQ